MEEGNEAVWREAQSFSSESVPNETFAGINKVSKNWEKEPDLSCLCPAFTNSKIKDQFEQKCKWNNARRLQAPNCQKDWYELLVKNTLPCMGKKFYCICPCENIGGGGKLLGPFPLVSQLIERPLAEIYHSTKFLSSTTETFRIKVQYWEFNSEVGSTPRGWPSKFKKSLKALLFFSF